MDIKDIKKAGINNADEIDVKEYELKDKSRKIKYEEIKVKRQPEEKDEHKTRKLKKLLKRFWFIVWKDDSFKGWLISLLFIFVVIKFIFFPLLSLVTGTSLPLAIVESCSMHHKGNILGNFDNWYSRHDEKYYDLGITQSQFSNFIFRKGFSKGDILLIVKAKPQKIDIGDIIIFDAGQRNPIIHRVINISYNLQTGERTFSTEGDNNNGQLEMEKSISEEQLVGRPILRIAPSLGWMKLVFYEGKRPYYERGFCIEN